MPCTAIAVDHRVGAETALAGCGVIRRVGIDIVRLVVEPDPSSPAEGMTEPRGTRAGNADEHNRLGPRGAGRRLQFSFTHARTFLHWETISGRP